MSSIRARIWLCADDYGISPSVNAAIRDLISRGRINATSVMVVAPSFRRSEAEALKALNVGGRRAAIGLHVTLTAPFRPMSAGFAPTRAEAFPTLSDVLARAWLRQLRHEHLAREIAAQFDAFTAAFGRAPDFIDGHQHVQLFPQLREALLMATKTRAPLAWVRQCGRRSPLARRLADRKGLLLDVLSRSFRVRAAQHGVPTNAAFAGTYAFAGNADYAALFESFLDRLAENSVVMCHPGFVDEELARLDPVTTQREREYEYFAGERFPAVLAAHGVDLA